jgi:hypothetical protein
MSVAFVAAEVTGDRVAWRVTSACKTRVNSGDEIWTAKSPFFGGRPTVDLWCGDLGLRPISRCGGGNWFLCRHTWSYVLGHDKLSLATIRLEFP